MSRARKARAHARYVEGAKAGSRQYWKDHQRHVRHIMACMACITGKGWEVRLMPFSTDALKKLGFSRKWVGL